MASLVSCVLHAAVLVFAMASWISVNAVFTQLPILANVTPESWNIASYLVLIIQLSCLVPFLYGVAKHRFARALHSAENGIVLVMLALVVAGIASLPSVYQKRTVIFGAEHAVPLLVVLFLVCVPCTTSDVLFLPYMDHFTEDNSRLLTTFFVGMGLGALIPSSLAFIQGSPTVTAISSNATRHTTFQIDARVSFDAFMYIVAGFSVLSIFAFFYLMYWVRCNSGKHTPASFIHVDTTGRDKKPVLLNSYILVLLLLSFFVGALQNSVVPVLLQYAAQKYGQHTYHLANTLFVMTNPIFCLLQLFVTVRRLRVFCILFAGCLAPTIVIAVSACVPEKISWPAIEGLICTCAGLSAGMLSWSKTALAHSLRASQHPRALFWCGAAIQAGSCIAALAMFVLANLMHVFPGS